MSKLTTTARAGLPARPDCPTPQAVFAAKKEDLPALAARIEKANRPITPERAAKAVAVLLAQIPKQVSTMGENPQPFVDGMIEELCQYPEPVVDAAIRRARRECKWTPSIAEMVEFCEKTNARHRDAARALRIRSDMLEKGWSGPSPDYFWMLEHMAAGPVDLNNLLGSE